MRKLGGGAGSLKNQGDGSTGGRESQDTEEKKLMWGEKQETTRLKGRRATRPGERGSVH